MFPRSSNFIYKPYCTFLTSKIQFTTSGGRLQNKNIGSNSAPNSSLPTSVLSTPSSVINSICVPKILKTTSRKNQRDNIYRCVSNAASKSNIQDDILLRDYLNAHLLPPPTPLKSKASNNFFYIPTKLQIGDSFCFYNGNYFHMSMIEKINKQYVNLSSPKHDNDVGSQAKASAPNKDFSKEVNWNDLPTDDQMDEMISYFHNEAPKIFTRTGWSYMKCSYKVIFENKFAGTKTETLNSYIMQIDLMRNITKMVLYNPEIHIMRMTKDTSDGSIHVRWQVVGAPRYILPLTYLGLVDERTSMRYIDGFSIFYMKKDGLYHRHVLMNMTPRRIAGFKNVISQIFANIMYRPTLKPDLGASVSNDRT